MMADAEGRIIPGDLIGPIVARSLGAQSVVTPISSNTAVTESGFFHHVETCKIGSPLCHCRDGTAGEPKVI